MEPIYISANTAVYKTGALIVVAALLALADAIFLMSTGAAQTGFALPVVFMLLMGCYGLVAGVSDLVKWRRSRTVPALLLSKEGITDATGTITGGLVRWDEVQSVSKVRVNDHYSLAVQLADNAGYLARLPAWKRFFLSSNVVTYGAPFLVSEAELAISADEARILIEGAQRTATRAVVTEPLPQPSAHWWTAIPPEERAVVPLLSGR